MKKLIPTTLGNQWLIRRLDRKDLLSLLPFFNKIFKKDFYKDYPGVAALYQKELFNRKYFQDVLGSKYDLALGTFSNGRLIGFLLALSHLAGVIYLAFLMVHDKYQGRGIGSELLKVMEKQALKNDFHHIFLETEEKANIRYYQTHGYKYIGVREKAWLGVDEYLMQKILQEPAQKSFRKKVLKMFKNNCLTYDIEHVNRGKKDKGKLFEICAII